MLPEQSGHCLHTHIGQYRLRPSGHRHFRLSNAVWRAACEAGVALHRPTHRGCRGGARKQRPIRVIVSARPTAPAKPVPRVRHLTRTNNYNIQVPCGKWELPVVINTNIRSVVPKITELSEILKLNRADIATITETLCRDHIPDESISVPWYFHFRKDRGVRRGGGVMSFVKHGIPFKEWTFLHTN